eukprot:4161996-Prymnesium_polylepis.3
MMQTFEGLLVSSRWVGTQSTIDVDFIKDGLLGRFEGVLSPCSLHLATLLERACFDKLKSHLRFAPARCSTAVTV